MSMSLTPRQAAAKAFIQGYLDDHGRAPSYSEIAQGIGLASKSGVVRMIDGLEERGHLRRMPNRTRALEVIGSGMAPDLRAMATTDLRALAGRVGAELQRRVG